MQEGFSDGEPFAPAAGEVAGGLFWVWPVQVAQHEFNPRNALANTTQLGDAVHENAPCARPRIKVTVLANFGDAQTFFLHAFTVVDGDSSREQAQKRRFSAAIIANDS